MDIEYLACGNIMSDRIENKDGTYSDWSMGGPAFFALSGIRLWTKSCKLVCQTGADAAETYGVWMERNGLTQESVRFEAEQTTRFTLKYVEGGKFIPTPHFSMEHLGYLKTHPDEIEEACTSAVKGIYLAQNTDAVFWEKLGRVKEKYGFKIMWEVEYARIFASSVSRKEFLSKVRYAMLVADMWSINYNEASDLFNLSQEDDEAIINEIQKLPVELTLFRVGKRGSYAVTPTNAFFCESINPAGPSVDPTGCGNNSTAAAMYAHVSGESPGMVAIMANISSGYNAAQHGPYPLYTDETMAYARNLAKRYFDKLKQQQKL